MSSLLADKVVLIVGATGGLGNAAAQAFSNQGAQLILAGRDAEKLNKLRQKFSSPVFQVDVANPESIEALKNSVTRVDIVVNLTGADVRKRFESHTLDEIQRLISINLAGSIYLTRAFLPMLKSQPRGVMLHVGGFADGRLSFPFYSVDAATRAGLSAFIEAMNRELRLEKNSARLIYFSPSPADTEAERPFQNIWREMGLRVESPARVADELLRAVLSPHERYLMGGVVTDIFARINSAFPRVADVLMMNRYGGILQKHLGG